MSVLAFFGQHLREGGHHIEVQAVHFVVEALGIQGALRSENRHGVIDVLLFVRRDSGKGLAKTSRRYLRDAGIACDGEGFQHDFLDDQEPIKSRSAMQPRNASRSRLQCMASTLLSTSTPILRPSAANEAAWPRSPAACSSASATSAGSSQISDREV